MPYKSGYLIFNIISIHLDSNESKYSIKFYERTKKKLIIWRSLVQVLAGPLKKQLRIRNCFFSLSA